ncbi:hypothetical protein DDA93_13685 [Arthrobacter sp. Bz4]|nr:hypothetical protein DDA93_13685 [Arthrobacter sp. Bz4]
MSALWVLSPRALQDQILQTVQPACWPGQRACRYCGVHRPKHSRRNPAWT